MEVIRSLFKYLPLYEDFFENFLIRAPVSRSLNDPFEVNPSNDFFASLLYQIKDFRHGPTKKIIRYTLDKTEKHEKFRNGGVGFYDQTGIISLSETKDNLLMWSHYAQEHNGMVIEFDTTHGFFTSQYINDSDYFSGKVHRVLYSKRRLCDFDMSDNSTSWLEPFINKSDEWIYEKEHRFLVNVHKANVILINTQEDTSQIQGIKVKPFNESFNEIINCTYMGSLQSIPSILFMFKIPEICIKSITFGVSMATNKKDKVIDVIKSNPSLNHCQLFNASLSRDHYHLDFKLLET